MAHTSDLFAQATAILADNSRGSFTVPDEGLYPHQWLWDSCFIAIGLAHVDVARAQTELVSLLRGQWSNGMLPNMIFDSALKYQQDRNIWRSQVSPFAPMDVSTTGITQPPLLAEAVVRVGKKLKIAERRTWYKQMYPALVAYHEWLYKERDLEGVGLVLQIHPYETGMDSTPPWLHEMHKLHKPWWISIIEATKLDTLVDSFRRDTRHVPANQRMSNIDALLYYNLIRTIRIGKYDSKASLHKKSIAMYDLAFNSIFIRANEQLVEIAKTIREKLPDELVDNVAKTRVALEQLWDNYSSQYYSKNANTRKLVRIPTIATLLPLYGGSITQERADILVSLLNDTNKFALPYPVPSVSADSAEFHPLRYWQGPMWVNMNWLIIDGLERYGYSKEANQIRTKTLALLEEHGCYEYFSPVDGTPAGANNFSWTAALALDLLAYR